MAKSAVNDVLDAMLDFIADNGNEINLCSAEPTTYLEAHTTYMLAQQALTVGDGNGDYTIADGDSSGRKLTVAQQASVSITNSGTATHAAIVKTSTQELLAVTTVTPQVLTAGGTVTIPSFKGEVSDPT